MIIYFDSLSALLTQKNNLHGRRIGKAKDAINPGDYVTKRQLNGNLVGTLANRPQQQNVVQGTTYFASDRNVNLSDEKWSLVLLYWNSKL